MLSHVVHKVLSHVVHKVLSHVVHKVLSLVVRSVLSLVVAVNSATRPISITSSIVIVSSQYG